MADGARELAAARAAALQRENAARPPQRAEFVCEAVAEVVADALAAGDLRARLAAGGWQLVHVGDATCPDVPHSWADEALNLMAPGWIDPLGLVADLWRAAWTAGHQVGAAGHSADTTDDVESEARR